MAIKHTNKNEVKSQIPYGRGWNDGYEDDSAVAQRMVGADDKDVLQEEGVQFYQLLGMKQVELSAT